MRPFLARDSRCHFLSNLWTVLFLFLRTRSPKASFWGNAIPNEDVVECLMVSFLDLAAMESPHSLSFRTAWSIPLNSNELFLGDNEVPEKVTPPVGSTFQRSLVGHLPLP